MSVALAKENALVSDRLAVDRYLDSMLAPQGGPVCEAMRYAVLGAGQRLRPILALRTSAMLRADAAITLRAGASVELLHCASLIIDDLPCMDNEQVRRNRPAVHLQFGEATALLAAFALVGLAARSVAEHTCFQSRLLSMLDCNSLVGGQALDLALTGETRERNRSRVTHMKTVPLFQLAVEAGTLSATYSKVHSALLFQFGQEFGVAYQMMDDYLDGELDDAVAVDEQFSRARDLLDGFPERAGGLRDLLNHLNAKIWEEDRRHR